MYLTREDFLEKQLDEAIGALLFYSKTENYQNRIVDVKGYPHPMNLGSAVQGEEGKLARDTLVKLEENSANHRVITNTSAKEGKVQDYPEIGTYVEVVSNKTMETVIKGMLVQFDETIIKVINEGSNRDVFDARTHHFRGFEPPYMRK